MYVSILRGQKHARVISHFKDTKLKNIQKGRLKTAILKRYRRYIDKGNLHVMQQSKQSCWERFPTKQFQIYSQRYFACVEGGRRNSVFLGDIGRGKWSETRSSVALLILFAAEMEFPPTIQSAVRKASIYDPVCVNFNKSWTLS